jgi:Family of unknown function (DUF6011)
MVSTRESVAVIEDQETCGACNKTFDTLAEVFSHECEAITLRPEFRPQTHRGDSIDAPERHGSGRGTTERPNRSNRYAGACVKCGDHVPAEAGLLVRDNSASRGAAWGVEHKVGQCVSEARAQDAQADHTATGRSMSEKQEKFLRSLLAEKQPGADADGVVRVMNDAPDPRATAGAMIDALKSTPDAPKPKPQNVELEDGIYLFEGEVRKVYKTGRGFQVAKRFDVEAGEFEYVGKSGLRGLTAAHRMTLDQAKEFGAVYGKCCNCGITLTDERSIEAGIGPICAKQFSA